MEVLFHPRDCVTRPHVPRKEGVRVLISVEDCVSQARTSGKKVTSRSVSKNSLKQIGVMRLKLLKASRQDEETY